VRAQLLVTLVAASSVASAEPVWDGRTGFVRAGATAPPLESYDTPLNRALFGPFRIGVGAEKVSGDEGFTMAPRLGAIFVVDPSSVLTLSLGYSTINTQLNDHSDVDVIAPTRDVRINLGLTIKW
jgi:hypothetical protein